ncbi:30S ribosomal protein S3 [Planctomycetota bacterium]|jgi:small subunit ribosomal protein S3|nr:30S ribosomal protein S3 [Planctomycetota bacterium]MSR38099.1 30S ribosomal protein S3 [Planctomycetota bacterium]GDY00998.1 30S ribosomal protein S3 [Planctomycetota bacterium]
MGQKTHPTGFRIAITEQWRSRWYASKKDFSKFVVEDFKIRKFIRKEWAFAAIPKVEIERTGELVTVFLHTARPGILIGKKGAKVDKFREDLEKLTGKPVRMKIIEVHRPELEANLVAEGVAEQLSKRINYRRALKKVAETSMAAGAKGIKIRVAGRLQGSEMARIGNIRKGRVPCTTLRAQLDYGFAICATKSGSIGCKVWIFKGEYGPGETTNGLLPVRPAVEKTVV